MKHISEYLLAITEQQLAFQARLDAHTKQLEALAESSNIATIASLPQMEADLCALNATHSAINANINTARCSAA
ncbi:MAG: hypothetical protein ACXV7H_00605 [Methylobacter sp.]